MGLWTPALACLQSLGLYTPLADAFEPVTRSCYKSKFGRILLEPTNGLRDPRVQPTYNFQPTPKSSKGPNTNANTKEVNLNHPSLMFINEDFLLDTLTDIAVNEYGVEISYDTEVTDLVPCESTSSCKVITSSSLSS